MFEEFRVTVASHTPLAQWLSASISRTAIQTVLGGFNPEVVFAIDDAKLMSQPAVTRSVGGGLSEHCAKDGNQENSLVQSLQRDNQP